MGNKMLIDAAHPEETRVVVQRGDRVEEFDYESAARKQLRGNIYLAKVTRVEPSLQAAFVDYGGNRHGFLAFNEIHPDYYQIPVADRKALLEEEARENRASASDDIEEFEEHEADETALTTSEDEVTAASVDDLPAEDGTSHQDAMAEVIPLEAVLPQGISEELAEAIARAGEAADEIPREAVSGKTASLTDRLEALSEAELEGQDDAEDDMLEAEVAEVDAVNGEGTNGTTPEAVGAEDVLEEVPQRSRRRRRIYKIQEVIKRRQILLVQVVKEERGNKGAALTTYLSLAGRYTVLMPNTASGGGISRKIASHADRKRLRQIAAELDVPEGMGLIIRTAGASRTKAEIKRDFEYLLRLWENVRDLTLQSTAPALVYEEGNLIKRSIRDLYNKEIDEVLVAGEESYREAKEFMRMIMPSHAKNVKLYKEPEPIFLRYNVERQLDAMYNPYVTLKSGGYIVINQTEALVAIDVNSGKSTRQHSIEETALRTNLEAAEEISRQLRLRDLAGLIVIDFIDMEERRNNRTVERKLKDCLRHDRARIQIGRISAFGLLEMSRQRLRTGVLEGSTSQCPMCQGTGIIRSTESVALSVLRALEDYLRTQEVVDLTAITSNDVALYILNNKRRYLHDVEMRYNTRIGIVADERMHGSSFVIEKTDYATSPDSENNVVVQMDWAFEPPAQKQQEQSAESKRKSRRKKRRGRGDKEERIEAVSTEEVSSAGAVEDVASDDGEQEERSDQGEAVSEGGEQPVKKSRRRGRRGGRRQRAKREAAAGMATSAEEGVSVEAGEDEAQQSGADRELEQAADEPHDLPREETPPASALESMESAESAEQSGDDHGDKAPEAKAPAEEMAGRARAANSRQRNAALADNSGDAAVSESVMEERGARESRDEQPREEALAAVEGDTQEVERASRRRGWWQRR